jgi:molybdopterin/thiamine biosynthesis adenylyltransferase
MANSENEFDELYIKQIERNIGLISEDQQEKLRNSKVAVFGLGGLGGACFEVLVRSGIGRFSIVDKDIFDESNKNRQIFAFQSTLGAKKVDVAERFAKDVNPEVGIKKYESVDEENIDEILSKADAAVMAIDELKPCVIASREAREKNIPIIEGWAIPYGNVRVIASQTPSLEEIYQLPTKGRAISEISDEEFKRASLELILDLRRIEGVGEFYDEHVTKRVERGHIPSFGPIVWLTSVMMALETIKVLLNWGDIAYGPEFSLYDPFQRRIPKAT